MTKDYNPIDHNERRNYFGRKSKRYRVNDDQG